MAYKCKGGKATKNKTKKLKNLNQKNNGIKRNNNI